MGLEVPFHFGGRMTGAVRNRNAMIETIVANDPALVEAFEAGVDVRLGVSVWTLVAPRPGVSWVGRRAAGLTDGAASWFCDFDAAILATGRRDVGVAFPGWNLPGVMGATAAHHLLRRYDALEGKTFVIIGSGAEATSLAEALRSTGRTVAAIVEAAREAIDFSRLLPPRGFGRKDPCRQHDPPSSGARWRGGRIHRSARRPAERNHDPV